MLKYCAILLSFLWSAALPVQGEEGRFVSAVTLPIGHTVVIAEGDFEARSIGSFSLRLYEAADAPNETTFFIDGLIHSRDGVLEKVLLADINDDQQPDIVVVARSVGSGNYLAAYAFRFDDNQLIP